jgi:hypothetical protein
MYDNRLFQTAGGWPPLLGQLLSALEFAAWPSLRVVPSLLTDVSTPIINTTNND